MGNNLNNVMEQNNNQIQNINEINNLKNELTKANKIIEKQKSTINDLQNKLNNYNTNINNYQTQINNLKNIIIQKDVELNKNIENKLFEELKTQFIEITQSEKYESYFKKNDYETINKISQKDNLIIFVTKNDKIRFTNFLCNLNYKIETIDDSNIGGCIVQNSEESINNTILENLKEKINEYKGNI